MFINSLDTMQPQIFHFHHQNIGIDIPYYEFIGKKPWPHIIISAWMHGDEINWISIVRKFLSSCIESNIQDRISWKITIIPLLNPTGFHAMSRYVTIDGKDPNRSFGFTDDQFKTYTNYRCDAMVEKFWSNCDYAIDIHDAGWRWILIPHPRIHICESSICNNCTHEMAKYLDTKISFERKWWKNMLARYMQEKYEIPLLTVESWWWQVIYDVFHPQILKWINNILIKYWFIEWEVQLLSKQIYVKNRIYYRSQQWAELEIHVNLLDSVYTWDRLFTLHFWATWKSEIVIAKENWTVFSISNSNQVSEWRICMSTIA